MSDEDLIANFIIPARNWIQKGKASRGGAVAFQRAYHGSPHKFDKFSLDKIGTGEGRRLTGMGCTFASKKGRAGTLDRDLNGVYTRWGAWFSMGFDATC